MRASVALVPLVTVHQLTQWGSALVMRRDAPSPFSSSLSVEGSQTALLLLTFSGSHVLPPPCPISLG